MTSLRGSEGGDCEGSEGGHTPPVPPLWTRMTKFVNKYRHTKQIQITLLTFRWGKRDPSRFGKRGPSRFGKREDSMAVLEEPFAYDEIEKK